MCILDFTDIVALRILPLLLPCQTLNVEQKPVWRPFPIAKTTLDFVFKSLYALQLEYPKEAEYVWIILQTEIYEIDSESNKEVPSVKKLINDMQG